MRGGVSDTFGEDCARRISVVISVSVRLSQLRRKWTAGDRTRACCCRARRDIGERRWIDLAFNGKTSVILLGPSSRRAVQAHSSLTMPAHHSHKSKVIQL